MSADATPPRADLAELLERVRAGDEAALSQLLTDYEPRVRTAASMLLGPMLRPYLDSLDLVQSVHRELLPGLREGRFDLPDGARLLALAVTIIRRKVARTWRKARKQTGGPEGWEQVPDESADADPTAPIAVDDAVKRVLAELDGPDRELVELRLQGLATTEIAERLGCDAHALRARLSRLRRRLQEAGCEEWI
jgi:RNA polymerase sigma-70 factor (ECF subfamily)